MTFCQDCEKPLPLFIPACPHCGAMQIHLTASAPHTTTDSNKSKVTAVVLALLLGSIGVIGNITMFLL